jgi:uncharacterized protein YceH (UPF0502 family)
MEKEIATPEYYPLSLNALVNACNQKSNRDPVVQYDETVAEEALSALRAKGLAVRITGGESRVAKHAQRFTEKYNLGRREAAVICVLMLRGPQTPGELRGRTERLYPFDDLDAVEGTLNHLAEMGFVTKLTRQQGFKESRFGHLLSGEPAAAPEEPSTPEPRAASDRERISALETAVDDLRREFEDFRRRFE